MRIKQPETDATTRAIPLVSMDSFALDGAAWDSAHVVRQLVVPAAGARDVPAIARFVQKHAQSITSIYVSLDKAHMDIHRSERELYAAVHLLLSTVARTNIQDVRIRVPHAARRWCTRLCKDKLAALLPDILGSAEHVRHVTIKPYGLLKKTRGANELTHLFRKRREEKILALLMGTHKRLGEDSVLRNLDQALLQRIMKLGCSCTVDV